MSKRSNPALIGGFVIGAVALLVVGVMVFGSGRFFRETYKYILYFESDVSGLSEGANVKLKGVKIGTVDQVLLGVGGMAALSGNREKFFVPVIIELDADKTASLGAEAKPTPETIKTLVDRGLRAQLASESFVTGVLYVKLDLFPGMRGLRLAEEVGAPYPEIPTLPTQMEEVVVKAAQFFADLQRIDVRGIAEEAKATLTAARELLSSPGLRDALDHVDETIATVDSTLESLRATSDTTRAALEPLRRNLDPAIADLRATLAELRKTAGGAGTVLRPDSPLVVSLERTLDDVSAAANSLKDLALMLERHPDALLRGVGNREDD